MECGDAPLVVERTRCVLLYGGDAFDAVLNYALLALNGWLLVSWPTRPRRVARRLAVLAGFAVFQVGLCLALGCAGVSIVWCACLGALACDAAVVEKKTASLVKLGGLVVVAALDAGALAYYGVTQPALTSVAHACAIAVGALAWRAVLRPADATRSQLLPPGDDSTESVMTQPLTLAS